jgi:hypothetical protein
VVKYPITIVRWGMEKLWKFLKKEKEWLLPIITSLISIAKGWWTLNGIKLFWDTLSPGKIMLYITIILILFVLIRRFFSLVKFAVPRSWILKFGVYWDEEFNPHCPACMTAMSGSDYNNSLQCLKCNKGILLRYGSELLPLEVAVKKIKKQFGREDN